MNVRTILSGILFLRLVNGNQCIVKGKLYFEITVQMAIDILTNNE